jgi:hypothetical protein
MNKYYTKGSRSLPQKRWKVESGDPIPLICEIEKIGDTLDLPFIVLVFKGTKISPFIEVLEYLSCCLITIYFD